jgi:hypothetical protein
MQVAKNNMRERYPFDFNAFVECKSYSIFAHKGGKFFYLEGGANSGCRVLVEIEDQNGGQHIATAQGLHARETVRTLDTSALVRAMQRAADNGVGTLLDIASVPGFEPRSKIHNSAENVAYHRDGWFTTSRFSIETAAPAWAPDARAFDLREGIYLVFADGTFRLVPKRDYFKGYPFEESQLHHRDGSPPDARQGDLLFYEIPGIARDADEVADESSTEDYDRHLVDGWRLIEAARELTNGRHQRPSDVWAWPTITHPEHGVMELEGVYKVVFAPGVSRPFSREGGLD